MHPTAVLALAASPTLYCSCQTDIEIDLTLSLNDTWKILRMHPTAVLALAASPTLYCNCQTDIEIDLTLSLNDTWPLASCVGMGDLGVDGAESHGDPGISTLQKRSMVLNETRS